LTTPGLLFAGDLKKDGPEKQKRPAVARRFISGNLIYRQGRPEH
jgi:hypothetical protein